MEPRPPRHAYLIMSHGNFPILEKQLRFLDSENADFYVHIDKKVKNFDFDEFRDLPENSKVTFVERHSISWGDFSMVEAELSLLRSAVPGNYDYYHLLSGVDVPIKSREYIESYFSQRPGTNFINFQHPDISRQNLWRVRFYYPFQRWNIRVPALRRLLRNATMAAQLVLGTDRTRKLPPMTFQKGAQWFDITHGLAEYILSKETEIWSVFSRTYCPDEMFVHTAVINSPLRDTLPPNAFDDDNACCCRYIDWRRGNPYTFTDGDFEELVNAGPDYLFARKFDYSAFPGIVDRLFAYFSE